jgi:hypothetical protein
MDDPAPAGPLAAHGALIRRVESDALTLPALSALLLLGEVVSVLGRGGNSALSARRAECPSTWSPARA